MHGRFFRLLFTGLALCLLWVSSAFAQGPEMRALREEIHRRGTPPIALVLSGGGAKGLAHIGVLDVLDSAGIPIDLIVGTSMGAAIGGLYAAGYTPKELVKFAESTNWVDVLDFDDDSHRTERRISQKDNDNGVLSLRFTGFFKPVFPQAISSGQRLTMLLNSMVINAPHGGAQDFTHDLHVPFIALATDIVTGNRRLITHGDLTSAMRASITLPLRFTPLSEDSAILVDGGLLSNVPVDVAKDSAGADIVIASNTTAGMRPREDLTTPWDVADQVMTLMMQRLSREALRRADAVITPEIQLGAVDFQDVPAIIESGRIAARKMLPRLLELTAERRHSDRDVSGADNGELMLDILGKVTVQTYGLSVPDTVIGVLGQLHHDRVTRQSYQNQIAEPLLSAFRSRGYTLARIDSVCIYPGERTLELFVDEGRIANIMIAGNAAAHPEVVLREFPLSRGEVFRSQDAERGLHNLTSTGYYDFASIEIIRDEAWQGTTYQVRSSSSGALRQYDTLRRGPTLKLTVQERAPSVLRLGIFADNEYGAQFSTELENENVFGWGASISLKGGVGALNRYAALTFEAPRLLRTNLTMMLQGYTNYKDISVYATVPEVEIGKIFSNVTDVVRESHDYGMRIKVGGEVGRIAELSVEMRKEQQSFYSVRDAQSGVSLTHVTALKGEIDIDSRNDREFPQFGTYFSGFYEVGNKLIGGENSYTKIYALLEQAIPLSSLHTIIPRFTAGFGDLTLPRMEQFGLGGVESFYGLNDLESRGRQVLSGSLTYQIGIPHALLFPTFVSLRYDIGATWLQPEAIKFEALVHGLGIGIGFKTPLGLARFAIGENFRFNKTSTSTNELLDLNKPRFYFSIGSNL